MYDYESAKKARINFMHEFDSDTASGIGFSSDKLNEILKIKNSKRPGHGLSKKLRCTFVEGE
jgi:hypothetical protein